MSSTTQTTGIPTGTWNLDPVHSSIGFAVSYAGVGTFRGTFEEFDAKLVDGRLEGTVKVASVDVDDEKLVGHLQTPDFFDAEQYPELRFVSKSIERDGDRVSIEGDLTLRGVTKPVEITGTVTGPLENALRPAADRLRPGDDRQPPRLRDHLEHGAPGRRPGPRRRRHHHRQPRAGAGVVR